MHQLLHAAGILVAGQQLVDRLGSLVALRVRQKRAELAAGGNPPGQIQIDATQEAGVVDRCRGGLALGPCRDQGIDLPVQRRFGSGPAASQPANE
jgi:hypothetical protein